MRVAVLDDYQQVAERCADWKGQLAGHEVVFFSDHLADEEAVVARLAGFDAVVAMRERTPLARRALERLSRLRLVVTTGMSNDSIDLAAAREAGIVVCGTGSLAWPTAELTFGLILALARRIVVEDASVRAGGWQQSLGTGLYGKRLGVVGLGRLGSQVARLGRAFGMEVVAWSPRLTAERAEAQEVELVTKADLFARSDVITIHLRLADSTRCLVGEMELSAMAPTAYLVNTSRGPIVAEAALLAALEEGTIAGAALDVFDEEPLAADHPLRRAPHCILTPHVGYVTEENYRVFYGEAVEDLVSFAAGSPVRVLA